MCPQLLLPQALHVQQYKRAPHLVLRHPRAQSNCRAYVRTSPAKPYGVQNDWNVWFDIILVFEFWKHTSFSSVDLTHIQAALCRNPSLSYIRVELGFSLTILTIRLKFLV